MPEIDRLAAALTQGLAAHQAGRLDEATTLYRSVLAEAPDQFDALHLLGVVEAQKGGYENARALIARALATGFGTAQAWCNHGNVLQRLGRFEEALASYDRALALDPRSPEALCRRADAALQAQRAEEALAGYDAVLALRPDFVEAIANRGGALADLHRFDEALAAFDRALALRPRYAEAFYNRANALAKAGREEEAIADYDRALAIRPDYAKALHNLGGALTALRRYREAIEAFDRLLAIDPDHEYTRGYRLHARMQCCDWRDWAAEREGIVNAVRAGKRAMLPFQFVAISDSPADQQRCARAYALDKVPSRAAAAPATERRNERIHVAYLSADFHRHATAFLTAGLFERHDRARFEVTAVSFGPDLKDDMRGRLETSFERFLDVRARSDEEIADRLRGLGVDIAVDLKGYTRDSRPGVLAARAAPLQVSWLGYPGTMGAPFIDYILADRHVIPDDHRPYYDEEVVLLPDSYQVNDAKRPRVGNVPARAALGLPASGFVFCCFNRRYKIAPPIFDVWARLLRAVEGSVLWLLDPGEEARGHLRVEAERRGVAPERLVFAPVADLAEHITRHGAADLVLDTLPYNAHTTASDALWAGVPVVTCLGGAFAGRVAASLLNAVGAPDLATDSLAAYEALALKLAREPSTLAAFRARLEKARDTCPLFDTDRFRRHLESAYETMWQRHLRGEPPAGFAVEGRLSSA